MRGQCNVSDWEDIIQVFATADYTLGLKKDGTVVATGSNKYGQCAVSDWSNVIYIGSGYFDGSFGITEDGSILTTSRAFKFDEDYCLIPNDYRCQNWKVCDLSQEILIMNEDNTIDYFGKNKDIWGVLLNALNNGEYISDSNSIIDTNDTMQKQVNSEYNYTAAEFGELIRKGINGTLTYEEAELLERYQKHYK